MWPDLFEAERMISEFFIKSNVGLAVFDEQMHYRILNSYLAASNGTPIESHLGKHVREILADTVGIPVEEAIRKVFATASPVLDCELMGALPTKPNGGHWIDTFFPIADDSGTVKQVGAVVIELPQDFQVHQVAPHTQSNSSLLRSWKDIAQYVGTSVKTVQRWEQTYEFPIRRVHPNKGSVVFAFQKEINDWLQSRSVNPVRSFPPSLAREQRRRRL
jgi:predicted DNA-binding transcriptional regulator AlpA